MILGIELAVDDSDPASATTFDYFDWAGIAPNSYAHPSLWKQVRLVGTLPPLADTTPPTVAITAPTASATYTTSSSSLTLGGTAADNVGVTQVTWANSLGGSGTATGTTSWTASGIVLQPGANVLTITAQDAAGNSATATVTVTFDATLPTVAITSPTSLPTYSTSTSPLTLAGKASDNVGVTQVTWANSRGGRGTASGTTNWTASGIVLQPGANVLTITAQDAAGNSATATVTFTLDATPPTVSITAPSSLPTYTTSTSSLTLGGTAADNVGVTLVTWANSLGGSGTATGTTSWTASGIVLQPGTNVLTVTAWDAAGNTALASVTVTLSDTTPPMVSITAPTSGSTVSGTITVSASATDNVGVVGIQFQLDGTNLGTEVTAPPFAISWDTTTVTAGAHTLTAVARDAAGNATTSPAIAVTVDLPVSVYPTATPITVDGSLGEWSGATAVQFSGRSNTATAYLQWDATNLYVAFQVTDSQLNALATTRDNATLWRDDAVEIYIDTHNDRASTLQTDDYHFLVNLNNVQRDLRGTGSGEDSTWNATWQSAVQLQGTLNNNGDTDSGYTVEIAIPWAQIGVTPVSGMILGIELAVDDSDPASAT